MTRLALVIGLLLALFLVLWGSWRLDRRLFAAVSAVTAIFIAIFGVGAWQGSQAALVALPTEGIGFELENIRYLETGTRLQGKLVNNSDEPAAITTLLISQQICIQNDCETLESAKLILRRHLNPKTTANISEIIRIKENALPANATLQWDIKIHEVFGYRAAKGASGL